MKKKNSKSILEQSVSFSLYTHFVKSMYLHFFAEPDIFYGNGTIRIKGVKQVKVTDDYLSLDLQTRGCQNDSTYEDCVTEVYLDLLKEECDCLPFHLQNFSTEDEITKVLTELNKQTK